MESYELDELDRDLFKLLQANARMPIGDIAKSLGVSRPTATRRLERLQQDGVLHLLAETDIYAANKDFLIMLGVKVEGKPVSEVAEALALMPQTIVVNSVAGRYDIETLIAAETHEEMSDLLTRQIPAIEGTAERSPSLCLEVIKFESFKVPFL